jgi:type VI secretion system protein ImpE
MDAKELIKANRLTEARSRLIEEVKGSPSDPMKRTLLAQVLLFFGEWNKAERHLEILGMQNTRTEIGVQVYRNLISAERERSEVCAGKRRPGFLGTMPTWLDLYFVAWEKLKGGAIEEAVRMYGEIDEQSLDLSGTLDGTEFSGISDADAFLSLFLEVFLHDHYLWLPFTSLRELSIPAPKTLLDTLWTPAGITTWEGLTTSCFLPVTYPLSSGEGDDLVRLGRMTDWQELGGGFSRGRGQHVFLIGEEEKGILEIRELKFAFSRGREENEENS